MFSLGPSLSMYGGCMKHSITRCVLCCYLPSCFLIVNLYTHREVVTWGAGRFGQLGNNAQQDSIDLRHIAQSIPTDAGKVIQVRLRCVCYKLYTFPPTNHPICLVLLIVWGSLMYNYIQVSAGCGHTSLLTRRGKVFTCGDNRYFQLGEEQQLLVYSCFQKQQ